MQIERIIIDGAVSVEVKKIDNTKQTFRQSISNLSENSIQTLDALKVELLESAKIALIEPTLEVKTASYFDNTLRLVSEEDVQVFVDDLESYVSDLIIEETRILGQRVVEGSTDEEGNPLMENYTIQEPISETQCLTNFKALVSAGFGQELQYLSITQGTDTFQLNKLRLPLFDESRDDQTAHIFTCALLMIKSVLNRKLKEIN